MFSNSFRFLLVSCDVICVVVLVLVCVFCVVWFGLFVGCLLMLLCCVVVCSVCFGLFVLYCGDVFVVFGVVL